MNELRVVLVTRRFWPLSGSVERTVANLAWGLLDLGAHPIVVTARFDSRWPSDVVCREVPVHRLRVPPRRGWSTMRYMINLSRWLRKNQPDFDVVCVSDLAHEAHATIGALAGTKIPVVLRAESDDFTDPARSLKLTGRFLRRCQTASALVATGAATEAAAINAGFERSRIQLIPNGVPAVDQCSSANQLESRAALAEVNHDLYVPTDMPVAVCTEPFCPESELHLLVDAWQRVAQQWPYARLWLLGDGPLREELFRHIRVRGLGGRVALPGTFDDLQSVLTAADLLVLPGRSTREPFALLEAMAAGLPVIASRCPGHDGLVVEGETGRLVPLSDAEALAQAIQAAFENPQNTRAMAAAARERVRSLRTDREMARMHLELFRNVATSYTRRP